MVRRNGCRAKDPETCWKHGTAYREARLAADKIQSVFSSDKQKPETVTAPEPVHSTDINELLTDWGHKNFENLSDEELTEKYFQIRQAKVSAALKTGVQSAKDPRSVHVNGDYRAERRKLHNEVILDFLKQAKNTPCDHEVILMGGVSGAGKTNIRNILIPEGQYFTLDPDEVRAALASRGLAPRVKNEDFLTYGERSSLLYTEASYLTTRIGAALRKQGVNLVLDQTMTRQEDTKHRIEALHEAGYKNVKAIFVDIEVGTSQRRAIQRWRLGEEARLRGENTIGGRYMPPEVIALSKSPTPGSRSLNIETFNWAITNDVFTAWQLWDNNVDSRQAQKLNTFNWD